MFHHRELARNRTFSPQLRFERSYFLRQRYSFVRLNDIKHVRAAKVDGTGTDLKASQFSFGRPGDCMLKASPSSLGIPKRGGATIFRQGIDIVERAGQKGVFLRRINRTKSDVATIGERLSAFILREGADR